MDNCGGHTFDPITDLSARCKVCQRKFGIVNFFNTANFPVCMGPPKIYTGKQARVRIKRLDGTWEEIGIVKDVEYGLGYSITPHACECGAAKTGIKDFKPGHSSWCPVKEKP